MDLERIKAYNNECNNYKQQLYQMMAERKLLQETIDKQCAQLSQHLGKEVTVDNIEQIYNEKVQSIEHILESGESILKRIRQAESQEGTESVGDTTGSTGESTGGAGSTYGHMDRPGGQGQTGQSGVLGQRQMFNGANQGQNTYGMPASGFKMPESYANMMPGQVSGGQVSGAASVSQMPTSNNPFIQQSTFHGSMMGIQVAPRNEDIGVDEI